MAYIGKEPIVGNFQKCDAITVVNGQAAYTLQVSSTNVVPESANHMLVSLNGILQAPVTSFTVSGATLTFASNLATGDVIDFVILLGNVLDLGTPSDGTVTNAKLASDLISGETDIGGAIADADLFLMDDGAGGTLRKTAASRIKTYAGGANTPAFRATQGSQQSIANNSATKLTSLTEDYDTASAFASDKFTVPSGEGGKYFFNIQATYRTDDDIQYAGVLLYKNGSSNGHAYMVNNDYNDASLTVVVTASAADYFEAYAKHQQGGSQNVQLQEFSGFKIIE